ncbi:hypothetical protein OJ253_1775 [Cryptosporidium canis]|uniref:Uncharacterized protein n=1 Tax=Cryptosporidium canis TaxID=195482 RepID=A0A9D5HXF9_9CRYT|nr:hypothetical protein OJ253_1775 [Cryptosporidium canis]
MTKLKKAKSSKKLSFSDVGLEPKSIFELDDLSYKQRTRKSRKGSLDFDVNKNEASEKETEILTKSELKRSERKRKSLSKNNSKLERLKGTNDNELNTKINSTSSCESFKEFKNSIIDGSDEEEVKSNSFLSLEDSYKSVSDSSNSSIDTDSNDNSSTDHGEMLCPAEEHDEANSESKQDQIETDDFKIQVNDTYENLFDEILNDKIKKDEKTPTSKRIGMKKEADSDHDHLQEDHLEISGSVNQPQGEYNGDNVGAINHSLDDIDLASIREKVQECVDTKSISETPSPNKKSKRKMLYSFANSVWDYMKPVSLDELEKKQIESGIKSVESYPKNDPNISKIENDDVDQIKVESNETDDKLLCSDDFVEKSNYEKDLKQVDIIERSKSQEVIDSSNDYTQMSNTGVSSNDSPVISNSHNVSPAVTPARRSKRQMLYSFANSIWDYVKPVSLDELEGKNEENGQSSELPKPQESKNHFDTSDDVSDSEFYIRESEGEDEEAPQDEDIGNKQDQMDEKEDQVDHMLIQALEENKQDVSHEHNPDTHKEQVLGPVLKEVAEDNTIAPGISSESKYEEQKIELEQNIPESKMECAEAPASQEVEQPLVEALDSQDTVIPKGEERNQADKLIPVAELKEAPDERGGAQECADYSDSKHQETSLDQASAKSGYLDKIIQDIAADSSMIIEELSQMNLGDVKDRPEEVLRVPDLSEISSIQEMIDSSYRGLLQSHLEKPLEREIVDLCREDQQSVIRSADEDSAPQNVSDHFGSDQVMIERIENEILNTNLGIEEYNELFDRLHVHTDSNSDEFNMSALDLNTKPTEGSHLDRKDNDEATEQLSSIIPDVSKQSTQEVDDSLFMSISSCQFPPEDDAVFASERELRDQSGLECSFDAPECLTVSPDQIELCDSNSELLETRPPTRKTNKSQLFSKLYRLGNKMNRKSSEILRRIQQLNQEVATISKSESMEGVKKDIVSFVSLVEIAPEPIKAERRQLNKEERRLVREEIFPTKENTSKKLLDISVNTEIFDKAVSSQEKGVNTLSSNMGDVKSATKGTQTSSPPEKDEKIDSIFRNEIYKILDNNRLLRIGQKLKSGFANKDVSNDKEAKNSHCSPSRHRRERYIQPDNHRYDIVIQSSNYTKDYPDSGPNSNGIQKDQSTEVSDKSTIYMVNSRPEYRYKHDTNLVSAVNPNLANHSHNNYYIGGSSSSCSPPGSRTQGNNHQISNNSYCYSATNTPFTTYSEYTIKPNAYVDQLGRSNYHVNYYCGKSGGSDEVKRYMYVDGLTNSNNLNSYYFSPQGQAGSQMGVGI